MTKTCCGKFATVISPHCMRVDKKNYVDFYYNFKTTQHTLIKFSIKQLLNKFKGSYGLHPCFILVLNKTRVLIVLGRYPLSNPPVLHSWPPKLVQNYTKRRLLMC